MGKATQGKRPISFKALLITMFPISMFDSLSYLPYLTRKLCDAKGLYIIKAKHFKWNEEKGAFKHRPV